VNDRRSLDMLLLSLGMMAVLAAQFLSALADNAILIAAIAIIKTQGLPALVPLLQESFVVPFVLLAPFVGQVADRFPKGHVMLAGNLLKFSGALVMMLGANPFTAYGLIGIGAALYSPAKYGILAQMFGPAKLVRANGMMEGSTIVAILLGVLLGGWLADHSLSWAFGGVMSAYGLAALFNLFIPRLPPENAGAGFHPWYLLKQFIASLALLFKNPDARFSLLGTSIFWGSGITLRLMLFAWVPAALLITNNQTPANLMGVVSIGIVAGAAMAGMWITLSSVNRALIGGILLGPVILVLAFVTSLTTAMACMAAIGICGGVFVVPLNALLQERGHQTIGAGHALAVQNFVENIAMLLFVGAYSLAATTIPVTTAIAGFGLILLASISMLAMFRNIRIAQ
jgi:LPLT family lysophospholipid transporter-like MFS transporter